MALSITDVNNPDSPNFIATVTILLALTRT